MTTQSHTAVEEKSAHFRKKLVDLTGKRLLLSRLYDTEQEKDLTVPPNCGGFGRIRHFRRISNPKWPPDPLPMDPVCRALGEPQTDMMRAQVFQIAACNFRCWYCYVPYNLLEANSEYSGWLTPNEIVDLYLDQPDPPPVIDLSGGQPDLVPEWVPWMMEELNLRGLDAKVYLWSDDNLSTDYFWRFLSDAEIQLVTEYRNYSRVCCFKGFDRKSFRFNTRADATLFDKQFDLMKRLFALRIDLYAYTTFTTGSPESITDGMRSFVDRLQMLDENLPLRTVPLEIRAFTPVEKRLNFVTKEAMKNQYAAVEAWLRELENRYSSEERSRNIADIKLYCGKQQ